MVAVLVCACQQFLCDVVHILVVNSANSNCFNLAHNALLDDTTQTIEFHMEGRSQFNAARGEKAQHVNDHGNVTGINAIVKRLLQITQKGKDNFGRDKHLHYDRFGYATTHILQYIHCSILILHRLLCPRMTAKRTESSRKLDIIAR